MSTVKKVSRATAMTSCGTHLKKGFKFVKGGGVVKVTASKPKKVASKKKKPAAKTKKK